MTERVNHPSHYNQESIKIETIELIDLLTDRAAFDLGNAIKYICRAPYKPDAPLVEHLEKALWYVKDYTTSCSRENKGKVTLTKFESQQFLKVIKNLSTGSKDEQVCGEILHDIFNDMTVFNGSLSRTWRKLEATISSLKNTDDHHKRGSE